MQRTPNQKLTKLLIGAWEIEEHPKRYCGQHPWGPPITHWLFLGEYGLLVGPESVLPDAVADFDFGIRVGGIHADRSRHIAIYGKDPQGGGRGYYELDDNLLFIGLGITPGTRPPRFATDCGWYFSFARDPSFTLPHVWERSREPVRHPVIGTVTWEDTDWCWKTRVSIHGASAIDIEIEENLLCLGSQIDGVAKVVEWLGIEANLQEVLLGSGRHLAGFIFEDVDDTDVNVDEWDEARIGTTCEPIVLRCRNGECVLWLKTSLDEHLLNAYFRNESGDVRFEGVGSQ